MPRAARRDQDGVHCWVLTATAGGCWVQANIGCGWDYPLAPQQSGLYHNLSSMTVSPDTDGERLNYTNATDGLVYQFARVDMFGHKQWCEKDCPKDYTRIKGSISWAVDKTCQSPLLGLRAARDVE